MDYQDDDHEDHEIIDYEPDFTSNTPNLEALLTESSTTSHKYQFSLKSLMRHKIKHHSENKSLQDAKYFDKLLVDIEERKIMKLLLKIKNGTPPMRKAVLRQITDKAREFGAGPLFWLI